MKIELESGLFVSGKEIVIIDAAYGSGNNFEKDAAKLYKILYSCVPGGVFDEVYKLMTKEIERRKKPGSAGPTDTPEQKLAKIAAIVNEP